MYFLHLREEVVIKKTVFLSLRVLKWPDTNGSFCHFRLCGNLQEIGLLRETRDKRCHTTLSKLQ